MDSLLEKLLKARGGAYITLTEQGLITGFSSTAAHFADGQDSLVAGGDIRTAIPEIIGLEETIQAIARRQTESFLLQSISRPQSLYFDLYLFANPHPTIPEETIICILEDVSERRSLEQSLVQNSNETNLIIHQLKVAKNYIDQMIACIPDVLIVTTATGIIKTINPATIVLFGYTESELVNQPITLLLGQAKITPNRPTNCKTKMGVDLILDFSCSAIITDSRTQPDLIYIGRDITDITRQNERQELQYSISRVLAESSDIGLAITNVIATISNQLGWDLGEFWLPVHDRPNYLYCASLWHRPELQAPRLIHAHKNTLISFGQGMNGQIWQTGRPAFVAEIATEKNFVMVEQALGAGLVSAFGFPVIGSLGSEKEQPNILGTMTFFSRRMREADRELIKLMEALGRQIGQYLERKQAEAALLQQQEKTNRLLLNILPQSIAYRLRDEEVTIAESYEDVTVLFADLVGFTELSAQLSPTSLVEILNQLFSEFDQLTETFHLEKIKTIGDCYMAVGGLPEKRPDHAEAVADMALEMLAIIDEFNQSRELSPVDELNQKSLPSLSIRIGINTGPVVAGVIGLKKFTYDLWGDTVNTASRMESHGLPGTIQVTAATYERLKDRYFFADRGIVSVKGKGDMLTYILLGKRQG